MNTSLLGTPISAPASFRSRLLRLPRESVLGWMGLAAIVALAAALRFANLEALGYANHYYTAGITSMLQSWHNFFFAAAEPGGAVSIDKPPVGLWVQALSAYLLGVNGFAVVLPQILAGLASVGVLYQLVRRSFGIVAGWLAALGLAITPIVIATDRNNTIDSLLILTLLLAAWAFIKATESGKLRYLFLGAALVGIGFNIKMLQAYLPLPAFYGLYFLGASHSLRRKIVNLGLATGLLLAVSLSWAVAVDLTPADQRPYVGSSRNNTVMELILGHNGLSRLTGMGNLSGFLARLSGGNSGFQGGNGNSNLPGQGPGANGQFPPPSNGPNGQLRPPNLGNDGNAPHGGNGNFPQQGPGANGQFPPPSTGPNGQLQSPNFGNAGNAQSGPGGPNGPGGRGGFPGTGQPSLLRLFIPPLSKEVSWLLPFGLFGAGLLVFSPHRRWPLAAEHQSLVLWGGWLLTGGAFFSIAGLFHEYYLSMIAAPLAALVGAGVVELWRLRERRPWLAIGLLLSAAGVTLAFQTVTALSFTTTAWWLPLTFGLLVIGAALLLASTGRQVRYVSIAGFVCVVTALLITPGIWSVLTLLNSSNNQSLPSAYAGQESGPSNRGGLHLNAELLDYLTANTQDIEYLLAVPSSMQGADYVIATERPVLYLGGFSGQDQVVTAEGLSQMVADGELRYIYWSANGGNRPGAGRNNRPDISEWVTSVCAPVPGYDTASVSAGAPDGAPGGLSNGGMPFSGNRQMELTLYDCSGH